jgi:TPR repeat protein
MIIRALGLGITATLASILPLASDASAARSMQPQDMTAVDSDGDGLPDAEDPYPLIADPRMLSWSVVKIEIGWGIKTGSVVTAQEALTWGTEESDVQVQGDRTKILSEADSSVAVGAKAEPSANPLTAFGLLGTKASLGFQSKAGLSYTRDLDWSSTRRAESRQASEYVQKATSETRLDSPYIAVWIEFSNHSDRDLMLIPAPLPVYSGGKPVCNVSIAGAEDVGRDGILLPARREGVVREFKATLDTTGPLAQLLKGMESASPAVFLEKSSIVVRDPTGADAVSLARVIDGKTVPLTVSAGGVMNSWRMARVDERTRQPVTLAQALESINGRMQKELNTPPIFTIEGGQLKDIAGLPPKSDAGQWSLRLGDQPKDPSNAEALAQPIGAAGAVAISFKDRDAIIGEELDGAQALLGGTADERERAVAIIRPLAQRGNARAQSALGNVLLCGRGVPRDEVEAVRWLLKAAEQGDAAAQEQLGQCLCAGQGVEKAESEGVRWYREAASRGSARAQTLLGLRYESGLGVPKDEGEALIWYRKAASQGFGIAETAIGNCYRTGRGVTKDQSEALRWYRKAADRGEPVGQYRLGLCYHFGTGVSQDLPEAMRWYQRAAQQGLARAQLILGTCFQVPLDKTRDPDLSEALIWYRMAAEQGLPEAQVALAFQDAVERRALLQRAAEGGCSVAMRWLAWAYRDGWGVTKDHSEALLWYRKAASQGDAVAQTHLGMVYEQGALGQESDSAEALRWFRKAADQDYALAQLLLADIYREGKGVAKDEEMALHWERRSERSTYQVRSPTEELQEILADLRGTEGNSVDLDGPLRVCWPHP